jgi:hypothetical protein
MRFLRSLSCLKLQGRLQDYIHCHTYWSELILFRPKILHLVGQINIVGDIAGNSPISRF